MSPLLLLKIVVPETRIFAPARIAIFEFSKFIPPSISISKSKSFADLSFLSSPILDKRL